MRLLASYRDLLSPYGFEVFTADCGEKAMPIVEQHPDILLVILDLVMPEMDGRQWLQWFRTLRSDSPVIIISGHRAGDDDQLSAAAFLEKPFHPAELLDLVGLFCGLGTPSASFGSV